MPASWGLVKPGFVSPCMIVNDPPGMATIWVVGDPGIVLVQVISPVCGS